MVQINFARKEVNCKIVYYGCGLSGKTTNLEVVHEKAPQDRKGELTSIATEGDRTLFFDFMPLELGKVGGMNTKFQLYTVPGQVYYNATRKLVLQGSDGVIFVVDSQKDKLQENIDSLNNLAENLKEQGLDIKKLPLVIQYNKRDLPGAMTIPELEKEINSYGAPYFEAVAVTGEGVFPTLKKLSSMVLDSLNKQYGVGGKGAPAAGAKETVGAQSSVMKKAESGEISQQKPKREEVPAAKEKGKLSKVGALEGAGGKAERGGGAAAGTAEREEPPEKVKLRSEGLGAPKREERSERKAEADRARRDAGAGEDASPPRRERREEDRPRPKQPREVDEDRERARGGRGVSFALYGIVALLLVTFIALVVTGRLNELLGKFMK